MTLLLLLLTMSALGHLVLVLRLGEDETFTITHEVLDDETHGTDSHVREFAAYPDGRVIWALGAGSYRQMNLTPEGVSWLQGRAESTGVLESGPQRASPAREVLTAHLTPVLDGTCLEDGLSFLHARPLLPHDSTCDWS